MMISFAAFQSKQTAWDLLALVAIGLLGIFMRRFEWPRPAFLIGFVLADQAEVYTYQAYQFGSRKGFWEYFASPTVGILLVITVVSVWLGARQSAQISEAQAEDATAVTNKTPSTIFAAFIVAFLALAVWDAVSIGPAIDKVFPLAVGGVSLICAILLLIQTIRSPASAAVISDTEQAGEDANAPYSLWPMLGWLIALIVLTALFGFVIALALFFFIFLRARAGLEWPRIAILAAAGIAVLLVLAYALNRDFPPGILQEYVNLPWPFK